MDRAAMGLRVHSGWAVLVVIGGTPREPKILDRRRIVIADPTMAGSKQPFHAAEAMEFKQAEAHISACTARTWKMAREELRQAIETMRSAKHEVKACGLLLASGKPVATLREALSSHSMLHTAEGQFFRDALRDASEHHGVRVVGVREKELFAQAEKILRITEDKLRQRITEMGKAIGPPWSQDEKLAALAAWVTLKT